MYNNYITFFFTASFIKSFISLQMVEQHFCLRWNNYRTNITAEFETLREGEHFVDVTLACDGQQLKAHKVVLSACSPYFKELLQVSENLPVM